MANQDPIQRGVAYTVVFPIQDSNGANVTGQAAVTSRQVSKDNGTFATTTNSVTELATASGVYALVLTATEMTADIVTVKIVTASYGTINVIINTHSGEQSPDHQNFLLPFGATSQSILFSITKKDGSPYNGLTYATVATLMSAISEDGMVNGNITLVSLAAFNSAWASGGFIQIDASAAPGIYRFDIPDVWLNTTAYKRVYLSFYLGIADMANVKLTITVGAPLTATERTSIADALLDEANGVETGITLRQAQRLVLAALAGKLSGAATTTITIRNATDTKNRIVATVDQDGNRLAVTLDGT